MNFPKTITAVCHLLILLFCLYVGDRVIEVLREYYFYDRHGIDSAGFVTLISNVARTGLIQSAIFDSFGSLLPTLSMDYETFVNFDFVSINNNFNIFINGHAYLIAYVLGGFVLLGFSALDVAAFFNALGLLGVCVVAASYFWKEKLNPAISFLFILAVVQFLPVKATIFGQFYFDKLFPFFMLWLCVQTHKVLHEDETKRSGYALFLILALLTATISERTSLMAGSFILVYSALSFSKHGAFSRQVVVSFFTGILLLAWYLVYTKLIQDSPYAGTLQPSLLVNNAKRLWLDETFQAKALILLSVLFPSLLFGMAAPRAGIIALVATLPNFLVDVGGAEKTGFATHYHMMYLPFIIFANMMALHGLATKTGHKASVYRVNPFRAAAIFGILIILVFNSLAKINYQTLSIELATSIKRSNPMIAGLKGGVSAKARYAEDFRNAIDRPEEPVSVSATNFLMPVMAEANFKSIDTFPVSIFDATALFVERHEVVVADEPKLLVSVNSYDQGSILKKRIWLQNYIDQNFDIEREELFLDGKYALTLYFRKPPVQ